MQRMATPSPVSPLQKAGTSRLGDLVRRRRIAAQLTQRELAELAGVGLRLISELERGKPTLRLDAVNKVLRVFGLTLGPVDAPRSEDDA
jgi:y4mF family transcriptional regulator